MFLRDHHQTLFMLTIASVTAASSENVTQLARQVRKSRFGCPKRNDFGTSSVKLWGLFLKCIIYVRGLTTIVPPSVTNLESPIRRVLWLEWRFVQIESPTLSRTSYIYEYKCQSTSIRNSNTTPNLFLSMHHRASISALFQPPLCKHPNRNRVCPFQRANAAVKLLHKMEALRSVPVTMLSGFLGVGMVQALVSCAGAASRCHVCPNRHFKR